MDSKSSPMPALMLIALLAIAMAVPRQSTPDPAGSDQGGMEAPPATVLPVPPNTAPNEPPADPAPLVPAFEGSAVSEAVHQGILWQIIDQLEQDAKIYESVENALDAPPEQTATLDSLADVQKIVKPQIHASHDQAFTTNIAPLLDSVNGERWDRAKAKDGFGQVKATKRAIAAEMRKHAKPRAAAKPVSKAPPAAPEMPAS